MLVFELPDFQLASELSETLQTEKADLPIIPTAIPAFLPPDPPSLDPESGTADDVESGEAAPGNDREVATGTTVAVSVLTRTPASLPVDSTVCMLDAVLERRAPLPGVRGGTEVPVARSELSV